MQKLLHFFSKNVIVYAIFNDQSFNDMLNNDILSFIQLGPVLFVFEKSTYLARSVVVQTGHELSQRYYIYYLHLNRYGKFPKNSDTFLLTFLPKFCFYAVVFKTFSGMTNSVDPDHTAPSSGAV